MVEPCKNVWTGVSGELTRIGPGSHVFDGGTLANMTEWSVLHGDVGCIPPGSLHRVPDLIDWCKGLNVTSAEWQVTLCNPIWHVSFQSGEGLLQTTVFCLHLRPYVSQFLWIFLWWPGLMTRMQQYRSTACEYRSVKNCSWSSTDTGLCLIVFATLTTQHASSACGHLAGDGFFASSLPAWG